MALGIGDYLRIEGDDYIIAEVEMNKIVLTNMKDGTKWTSPRYVPDMYNIQKSDLSCIIGTDWRAIE